MGKVDKEHIIDVIKRQMVDNLEDISMEDISIHKSLLSYGAGSLDVLEIISCAMRELNIRVPRTELADIKCIDELADRFYKYANEEQESAEGGDTETNESG